MPSPSLEPVPPQYLTDASGYTGNGSRLIIPEDEAGVVEVLRAAREQNIPVTLAGAGSGLTGARVPQGGWVVSLEKFRKLEIGHGWARVGPAITLLELRDAARPTRSEEH